MNNIPTRPKVNAKPNVILFVGVNGAGKTTSIGKFGHMLKSQGKKVVLGAGDTFRAAAVAQLKIWATRIGAEFIEGKEGSDPASVLFEAVTKAKNIDADYVLCDTAGRLHSKISLMDELKKTTRVLNKAMEGAPHEIYLVIDATMGQNAMAQAREFMQAIPLSGVILSKLDGTAKGGVAIGIVDELKTPISYVGIGESANDFKQFDASEFVEALFV
jgi:fused signal recognition particle receptor